MTRKRSKRQGSTLAEVVMASAATVLVLSAAIGTFLSSTQTWLQGEQKIQANSQVQNSIKTMGKELREAMSVVVDGDGMGLTYREATKDVNGEYIMPMTWDGVTRRIEKYGTTVRVVDAGVARTICKNVFPTDPNSGFSVTYKLFKPGAGTITRSLAVMVVTKENGIRGAHQYGRARENVFLRNIPELTR
ncbi:MAG: hypothetical protein H7Y17_07955 [Chlorobia bacterium]|nr:hypothetical protein [Fimbriimonadaceae bacterium]